MDPEEYLGKCSFATSGAKKYHFRSTQSGQHTKASFASFEFKKYSFRSMTSEKCSIQRTRVKCSMRSTLELREDVENEQEDEVVQYDDAVEDEDANVDEMVQYEESITTNKPSSLINTTFSSSGSQSMDIAGAGGSVTSDQTEMLKTPPTGDSRETTPPDDFGDVSEQLEHEQTLPSDKNNETFDMTFEPQLEDQVQLTMSVGCDTRLIDASTAQENDEEEDVDEEVVQYDDAVEDENVDEEIQYIETTRMNEEERQRRFGHIRIPRPHVDKPRRFFISGPLSAKSGFVNKRKERRLRILRLRLVNTNEQGERPIRQSELDVFEFRDDSEMLIMSNRTSIRHPVYAGAYEMLREAFEATFCGPPLTLRASKTTESRKKRGLKNSGNGTNPTKKRCMKPRIASQIR